MITILNRAELLLTMDLSQQTKVRAALAKAGIDYKLQVTGSNNITSAFGHLSTGEGGGYKTYQFYVHKQDLEAARAAIHNLH